MASYGIVQIMGANSIDAAGTEYSDPFKLGDSRFFALEWNNSAAIQFDAVLQMKTADGEWINATSGSALLTNQTAQRGFVDISPPYSRREYRVAITNDDGSARSFSLYIHQNLPGRV